MNFVLARACDGRGAVSARDLAGNARSLKPLPGLEGERKRRNGPADHFCLAVTSLDRKNGQRSVVGQSVDVLCS